jgi:amino acid transporter
MLWKQLFATKSLETLQAEVKGDNRLLRALGPVSLTALGVGAIIGAGIFVMTGRVAAQDAGPAVVLSFVVAGVGCLFAALCYAEFASMVPVAGSAYTYAYATLGEVFAWIIGWDLVLEYAMACACVASSWSKYLNELLLFFGLQVPPFLCSDPFSTDGAWFNLPAFLITLAVTAILVIGIKESATTNAIFVAIKVGVVLFVIGVGIAFISSRNWTEIPVADRLLPEEMLIPSLVKDHVEGVEKLKGDAARARTDQLTKETLATYKLEHRKRVAAELLAAGKHTADMAEKMVADAEKKYGDDLPKTDADRALVAKLLAQAKEKAPSKSTEKWGILGLVGLNKQLESIDDRVRSPFIPYGLAGIIFGASIVFFAYIGFDAISTQAEEARNPQRDVPLAILASLILCTALYIGVAAVITGMVPYPDISSEAAVAAAFRQAGQNQNIPMLRWAALLIAIGAIAGMTSVLMVTFLSQARIFLAMARDRLLPPGIFAAVHPVFRTPHRSTMLTGGIISLVAALTPIKDLEEMVNIGTLMAFVIVCAAVLLLRLRRPTAERPFRAPLLFLVAPLGILVNLIMMLFLPLATWARLVIWLIVGLVIYFGYGRRHSTIGQQMLLKDEG